MSETRNMRDIQSEQDVRNIPLAKVGVRGLCYPIFVLDKKNKKQATTAAVDLFVNLPHDYKGTHMSRFIEIFHRYRNDVSVKHFLLMLEEMREKLNAEKAYGTVRFPFFIEKESPVTKTKGMLSYDCAYEGIVGKDERKFFISIAVPVSTVCPCSKAISDYGAHNQRGIVRVKILYENFFWIEDIISLIENCASSPLYAVLKRSDEKFVTEHAYENPRFVEDVVREVYCALSDFPLEKKIAWFSIEAENFESIHNHNAYAYTEFSRKEKIKR